MAFHIYCWEILIFNQTRPPAYDFITKGIINDPEYIPSPGWKPETIYHSDDITTLSEFPFLPTTCVRNPNDCLFEDAIDHIFCSPEFRDHKIFYTPPSGEMPNETTGSYHVPVSCSVTLV